MKRYRFSLRKYKREIIVGLSALLFLLAASNIYHVLVVNQMSNDECTWSHAAHNDGETPSIYIDNVKEGGVTWNAGIRNEDILLSINGQSATTIFQFQAILNKIEAGDYAVYRVQRGDEIFTTKVYVKKIFSISNFSYTLFSFLWFIIGFILILTQPDGKLQKLFYLSGAGMVVMCSPLSMLPILHANYSYTVYAVYQHLWLILSAFTPAWLIHFFLHFPRQSKWTEKKRVIQILYAIPVVIIILQLLWNFFPRPIDILIPLYLLHFQFTQSVAGVILFLTFVSAYIWGFFAILTAYFSKQYQRKRNHLLLILISYLLGVATLIYTNILIPTLDIIVFNNPEYYVPILFVTLLPVAFGISIFRYELMDVSAVVKNTVIYGIATVALASAYLGLVYLLGQMVGQAIGTEYQGIIAAITFLVFALVFQSARDRFQMLLTKKFYPEQFLYQQMLVDFTSDLINIVGYDRILDAVADMFSERLNVQRFGLLLVTRENELQLVRNKNFVNEHCCLQTPLNQMENYFLSLSDCGCPVAVEQVKFHEALPRDTELLRDEGIYTIVPMIVKNKLIGILTLGVKRTGLPFSGKELDLLSALANQTAVSLENARLYEAEVERREFEHDLLLARQIQQQLLPENLPESSGFSIYGRMEPAMHIGGDYFDVIEVNENKTFIVIGDVAGKGLPAALYMMKLQTMLQLTCNAFVTPREVLTEINKNMYGLLARNSFITITLALIDKKKKVMQFCRAGHMPTLLFENGHRKSYQPQGIAIGITDSELFNSSLEQVDIPLHNGQVFFFYSDGINEMMNKHGKMFGDDIMFETISSCTQCSPREIFHKLWEKMNAFRNGATQHDDVTSVIVKVNGLIESA